MFLSDGKISKQCQSQLYFVLYSRQCNEYTKDRFNHVAIIFNHFANCHAQIDLFNGCWYIKPVGEVPCALNLP